MLGNHLVGRLIIMASGMVDDSNLMAFMHLATLVIV